MAGAVDEVDLVRVVEAFGSLPPQDASRTVVPHTRHNVVGNLRLTKSLTLRHVDRLERPSDPCRFGAPEPPPPGQTFGVGSRSGRRRPEEPCRRHPHYVRSEVKPGGGDRRWDRFGRRRICLRRRRRRPARARKGQAHALPVKSARSLGDKHPTDLEAVKTTDNGLSQHVQRTAAAGESLEDLGSRAARPLQLGPQNPPVGSADRKGQQQQAHIRNPGRTEELGLVEAGPNREALTPKPAGR